jgi:hypothetical protein
MMHTSVVIAAVLAVAPALAAQGPAAGKKPDAARANSQARLEAARTVYQGWLKRHNETGEVKWDPEFLYRWSRRWLEAERELAEKKEQRVAASEAHLARMRRLEELLNRQMQAHEAARYEAAAATFYRLEAERWVTQAKAQ